MSTAVFSPGGGLTTVALNLSSAPATGASHVSPDLALLLAAACIAYNDRPEGTTNNPARTISTLRTKQKVLEGICEWGAGGLGSTGGSATAGVHEYSVHKSNAGTFTSGSLSGAYDGFVLLIRNRNTGAQVGRYFIPFISLQSTFNLAAINCAAV